ncbi:MAG TPA: hypothetical protein VF800_21360 [Telluria sp.]
MSYADAARAGRHGGRTPFHVQFERNHAVTFGNKELAALRAFLEDMHTNAIAKGMTQVRLL